ncbi:hypothetical protein PUN28_016619 [Cardiocondyla obscurior]|uniref:Uncharacterized protein n=1 Tax=Cardiocondyla obscurior TaxID=286306 RepID=A0AAW2EMV2_9HYME
MRFNKVNLCILLENYYYFVHKFMKDVILKHCYYSISHDLAVHYARPRVSDSSRFNLKIKHIIRYANKYIFQIDVLKYIRVSRVSINISCDLNRSLAYDPFPPLSKHVMIETSEK